MKSKGKGKATTLSHFERQIQHSYELMRIRQKALEKKNMEEWDKSNRMFFIITGGMLSFLYGLSVFMTWLCS